MTAAEPTAFLYPFIDAEEDDADALLADLAASAREKARTSAALRASTLVESGPAIAVTAAAMADRFARGGRLYAFGNGGSATDADGLVARFRRPPAGHSPTAQPLPAHSLVEDRATLTALANDVGFDVVFARQLDAHARPDDIAVGLSTRGGSTTVLAAMAAARRLGLLTVGICGYDGGALAASGDVDHCLVVRSESVHRIQEAQDAVGRALWATVHHTLREGDQ